MDRIEFLRILESELDGEISSAQVDQNLRYYDSYIREQINQGLTEEEVMGQLGDPRLIARTIVDTAEAASESLYEEEEKFERQEEPFRGNKFYVNGKMIDFSKWYVKLLVGIIAVLAVVIVISIAVLIIRVALWLALPILVICAILYLLQRFFYK